MHIPKLETLLPVFEHLRAKMSLPGEESSREVFFVDARMVPAGEGHERPQVEDYVAVPMVAEVVAGPGIIPQDEVLSWFLVWRHQRAVSTKRDLIAVQIGKQSTSMTPTLHSLDIVLVDRQDRDVQNPGNIMLVMDEEGAGKIKRVAIERQPSKRDFRITYYSDNAAHNPPEVYSLREHFNDDWERAIVDRVVWAWSASRISRGASVGPLFSRHSRRASTKPARLAGIKKLTPCIPSTQFKAWHITHNTWGVVMIHYSHMVISFSEANGQESETFRSMYAATVFAEELPEEGESYDIIVCQILERVACQPHTADSLGLLPGHDYPLGLCSPRRPESTCSVMCCDPPFTPIRPEPPCAA